MSFFNFGFQQSDIVPSCKLLYNNKLLTLVTIISDVSQVNEVCSYGHIIYFI